MKKLLLGLIVATSLISLLGCNEDTKPAPKEVKSTKCGGDKKVTKNQKSGMADNNKTMKCGHGKCGGGK